MLVSNWILRFCQLHSHFRSIKLGHSKHTFQNRSQGENKQRPICWQWHQRFILWFELAIFLNWVPCEHPNNHFVVFGQLNQIWQNCIVWTQWCWAKACVQAWDKICAKNSNKSRLWLAEISNRMAHVYESICIRWDARMECVYQPLLGGVA